MPTREIAEAQDWYNTGRIEEGYEDMMDIFEFEVEMDEVEEQFFEQNLDANMFRAEIVATKQLDGRTELIIKVKMFSRPPYPEESDEGLFGLLQLEAYSRLNVKFPEVKFLPKFMEKTLRRIWWSLIYSREWQRWEEFAEEHLRLYMKSMREYYGLKPQGGKTRRLEYEPFF